MSVFTGWTGWAISAVLRYLGIRVGAPRDRVNEVPAAHAWRERDERILRGHLHAEAERLHGGDLPHCPRCLIGRDHRYLPIVIPCADHRPAGKHHATAPVYDADWIPAKSEYTAHDYVSWDHCDDCYAKFERVSNGDHIDEWVAEWNRRYAE